MFPQRLGIVVYLRDIKSARNLERFGSVHYISKRLHYVSMYIDEDKAEQSMLKISKLPYVKSIEKSFRKEIPVEYTSKFDKSKQVFE